VDRRIRIGLTLDDGSAVIHPGQLEPNEFELALLERLAVAHPPLREHLGHLHVLSREFTGVGCFTKFRLEGSRPEASEQQLGLNGLIVMPNVPNGMGAVLFCRGGQPEILETFTYGADHWDGEYDGFSIRETV